ncbi:hypothetical protein ACFL4O_02890 [bacterium]
MIKKSLYCLIFYFCLSSLIYSGVSVTPIRQEAVLSRGQVARGFFKLQTQGEFKKIKVTARSWFTLEENKEIPPAQWLAFDNDEFNFEDNKDNIVMWYTVKVPTNAVGELMAMISFTAATKQESILTQVYSVPLYIFIKGTEIFDGSVTDVLIKLKKDETECQITSENNGNVHFRPYGKCSFYKNKNEHFEIELKKGWPVYPGKSRMFLGRGAKLSNGKWKVYVEMYYKEHELLYKKKHKVYVKNNKIVKFK